MGHPPEEKDYLTSDTAFEIIQAIRPAQATLRDLRSLLVSLGIGDDKIAATIESLSEAQGMVAQVRLQGTPHPLGDESPDIDLQDPYVPSARDTERHAKAAMLDRAILNLRQLWGDLDVPTQRVVRAALEHLDPQLREWRS